MGFKKFIPQVKIDSAKRAKLLGFAPFYIINFFQDKHENVGHTNHKDLGKQAQADAAEVTI